MHEGHNWWCRPLALVVRNDLDVAVSEDGDAGIRGSEVDTHCILSRFARFLRGIFFGLPGCSSFLSWCRDISVIFRGFPGEFRRLRKTLLGHLVLTVKSWECGIFFGLP